MIHPKIDLEKCTGCGACVNVCPVKPRVIEIEEFNGKGKKCVVKHPEICDGGRACVMVCPTGAFELVDN